MRARCGPLDGCDGIVHLAAIVGDPACKREPELARSTNLDGSRFPLPCPDGRGAVIISTDRRTLTTVCVVEAGASYSMPIMDFVADGGAKSERYDLAFTTSTEAPLTDPRQAMALEKAGAAR